jgi:diguanylate cyclase (GGDEF)-like protein/PAS domain S-box-containing protein
VVLTGTNLLDDPSVHGVVVNWRDDTERVRAEETLKESEERFRTTFENAPVGVALIGLDGRRFRANRSLCKMLGFSEEDLLGVNYLEHVHPDDRQISTEHFQRALEEGAGSYELVRRYLRADGHVVWNLTSVSLIRDSKGNPSYFVCLHQDITERKQAEERLRRSEISLAAAQERAHLGSWEWDIRTDEVRWSDEHYRIFGYAPQSFTPTYETHYLNAIHPEDRECVEQAINEAFEGKPHSIDYRIVRPGDEVRHVYSHGEVLFDEGGEEPVGMAGTVQDITERKLAEELLHHQAFHDLLTDLPNRQLFVDRLKQALRRTKRRPRRKVAVLFMDLDNFKGVNDSLGHELGDRLLVAVGERLRGGLRPEDTLARFGGDEFTVLVDDVENSADAVRVAGRVIEALREPFVLESRELFIKPSIGIALGTARTSSSDELLREADTAMYQAKEEGLGYRVFEPVMYEQALRRLKMENELQRAIENEQFVVHYQPIIDLRSEEVWGMEALVRWRHPERRLLDPKEFIATAEKSALVVPMGEQVLEKACKQAKEWQEEHLRTPPLVMAVNLSATQVERSDLDRTVEGVLEKTGFEASRLSLDITETVYIDTLEGHTAALDNLKKMGVGISIDDFGTGYSSLAYLKRIPADTLKIDRSFIKGIGEDLEDTAIVQMVIDLAHTLGMEAIAEGVESEVQAEQLKEMGCDRGQGFYFAKPLSPEEATRFLSR